MALNSTDSYFVSCERVQIEGMQFNTSFNLKTGYVVWRHQASKGDDQYLIALESDQKLAAPVVCLIDGEYLRRQATSGQLVQWRELDNVRSASIEISRVRRVSQFLLVILNEAVVHCTIHPQLGLLHAKVLWGKSSTLRRDQGESNTLRSTIAGHIKEHGLTVDDPKF